MPYLGKSPQHGNYSKIDDFSGDFDGSDATHAIASNSIAITPVRPEALIISINGVIQEPVTDYTVSGTNITFTTAPASTDSFFGVVMGEQLAIGTPSDATITSAKLTGNLVTPGTLDINGQELILDADADTSITADTDNQIDIKIAGADDFQFTANKFLVQTGSSIDINGTELILDADADTSITADTDDQIDIKIAGADDFQFTADTFTAAGGSRIIQTDGIMFLGDTASGQQTLGLAINQGAADNEILTFKSSDVGHAGATFSNEGDTFGSFKKASAAEGGLYMQGYSEGATGIQGLSMHQTQPATSPGTSITASAYLYYAGCNDGAWGYDANTLIWGLRRITDGGSWRSIMFIDEDGDIHLDGSSNDAAFDEEDDAMLCRSLDLMRAPKNIIRSEFDRWTQDHKTTLEDTGIISKIDPDDPDQWDEDGNLSDPMVNITQLQRLHNGAIWQQRAMFETMKQVAEEMLPGFGAKLNERLVEQKLPALPVPA